MRGHYKWKPFLNEPCGAWFSFNLTQIIKMISNSKQQTSAVFDVEALRLSIQNENKFIKDLMDTVPPEIYFAPETVEELKQEKYLKADKILGEIKRKKNARPLSKKSKHKRAKLDPKLKWTVSSIHKEMALKEVDPLQLYIKNDPKLSNDKPVTREELKQRLQAKIKAMRGPSLDSLAENVEKKRLKRRLSKMKMREKRKKPKTERNTENKALMKKKSEPKKLQDAKSIVFNKDKSLVFNKFEFTEHGLGDKVKGELSGKNYKQLIKKVERKGQKLKQLEETDKEKADIVKEKNKWKTVLSRAEGIKVKDDLPLLKKALSKANQRKRSSGKKWKAREDNVKEKQEKRQKKRKDNIMARKKEKIKKKIKRSIKKGRMISGVQNI